MVSTRRFVNGSNISINIPADNHFLLSNFWFSLDAKDSLGIFCNNKEEKQTLLSLFREYNSNLEFHGLLDLNNKIINISRKGISKYVGLYDLKMFDNSKISQSRTIQEIENMVIRSNFNYLSNIIQINNNLDKYLRMQKIYKSQKVYHWYLKVVLSLIKESYKKIEKLDKEINNKKITKDDLIKINNKFINTHISYIRERIYVFIDRNSMLTDLYTKEYNNKLIFTKNESLSLRIEQIIKKLKLYEGFDKSLFKIRKDLQKIFFGPSNKENNSNEEKDVISSFIDEMNCKLRVYNKKIEKFDKTSNEYWIFFKRKNVCKRIIKLIKKECKNMHFNDKKTAIDFYHELVKQYKISIVNETSSNFNGIEIKKMKKYLSDFVEGEIQNIIRKYKNFIIKEHENEMLKNENNETKRTKVELDNIIKMIKIEVQDILDEIEWEKKTIYMELSKTTDKIAKEINELYEEYENLKKSYKKIISKFLESKNLAIQQSNKIFEDELETLSDEFFETESSKFESIYKFVSSDLKVLEKMLSKTIYIKDRYGKELIVLSRYMILKLAKLVNISIFDLLKRVGKLDDVSKRVALIFISYFDNKDVVVFDNLITSLDKPQDIEKFSFTFQKIIEQSDKPWILFEDDLSKSKDVVNKISIVDNTKIIEYGFKDEIISNPVYDTTLRFIGKKTTGERRTPQEYKSIIDFDVKYDDYKINDRHFVYGNIESISSWIDTTPQMTWKTVSIGSFNNFVNRKKFEKIQMRTKEKTNTIPIKLKKTQEMHLVDSEEFLIIDVKE